MTTTPAVGGGLRLDPAVALLARMSMPFQTREFRITDYAAVVRIWEASEGVEVAEGDSRADIDGYLRRNPGLSRVAESDGRIVGAVLCGHDGRRGLIYHLAVASEVRGIGLGALLLTECLDGLRALGLRRVILLVGESNPKGQGFWRSQGFERIDGALAFGRDL